MSTRALLLATVAAGAIAQPFAATPRRDNGPNAAVAARSSLRPTSTPRHRARHSPAVLPPHPNDPLWSASWGLRAAGAPAIWRPGRGSPTVVVAVVDTGVDGNEPDLAGAVVPGWNALDGSADTADGLGHGTAVASVIAARADNRIGSAGYCPRCSIMPVKVFDSSGRGPGSQIAAGIDWAVAHGAAVVNLSLVLTGPDTAVSAAVANAVAHGVLVVAAAGNDGETTQSYPAAEPGVISVAAADETAQLYPWSRSGTWVSVAAPGCNEAAAEGGGYAEFCGTSSAAAAVSGLLGLALSDGASAAGARAAVTATADHAGLVPQLDARALLAAVAPQPART